MDALTRNQKRAIAALLESKSIVDAAAACGLHERTIRRFIADPAFKAALTEAENERIDNATRRLIGLQETALDAFQKVFVRADEQAGLNVADFFIEEQYTDQETKQAATRLVLDIEKIKALGHLVKKIKVKGGSLEVESYDAQSAAALNLKAGEAVIDYLIKLRELRNIEQRIADLEERVFGAQK